MQLWSFLTFLISFKSVFVKSSLRAILLAYSFTLFREHKGGCKQSHYTGFYQLRTLKFGQPVPGAQLVGSCIKNDNTAHIFFFLLQLTLSLKQAGILVFVTEIPESSSSPPLGIMSVILICNSREHFHIINCFPVSSSSAVGGQQNKPSHHQVTDLSGEQCYPTCKP